MLFWWTLKREPKMWTPEIHLFTRGSLFINSHNLISKQMFRDPGESIAEFYEFLH